MKKLRKWLVNNVIAPLAYKVMPADGWNGDSIILSTGYFWVVMTNFRSMLSNEGPGTFKVRALQFSHDRLVQVWDFDMPTKDEVDVFLNKLGKTQGVNNICVLGNTKDLTAVWGDLDKLSAL